VHLSCVLPPVLHVVYAVLGVVVPEMQRSSPRGGASRVPGGLRVQRVVGLNVCKDVDCEYLTSMATLVYVGAGWDNSFLTCMPQYDRYILVDALPATPHYTSEHAGYAKSCDKETFFATLRDAFGPCVKHDANIMYFDKNIEYHYSTDADDFLKQGCLPADADILIRGFIPKKWKKRGVFKKHTTFVSCDTFCNFGVVVHLPDDDEDADGETCFCSKYCD
jgi:hypothetical protein